MKNLLACVLATSLAFAPSPDLRAQGHYPNKIIRLVVPYSAGGTGVQPFARARDTSDNPTPSGTACLIAALRLVGLLADRAQFAARADGQVVFALHRIDDAHLDAGQRQADAAGHVQALNRVGVGGHVRLGQAIALD